MRVKELEEVTDARNNKRKEYDDLRKQRLDEFMQGFSVITTKLKEMYQVNIFAFEHLDRVNIFAGTWAEKTGKET